MKRLKIVAIMIFALTIAPGAFAQPSQHGGAHMKKFEKKEKTVQAEDMPAMCKAMMAEHSEMAKKLKSMDVRLDEKITALEKATGDRRIDLMVDVIRELVTQRKAMGTQTMAGMHHMMGHMMTHMEAGTMMSDCPMMKKMMGGDPVEPPADDDHSKHGH